MVSIERVLQEIWHRGGMMGETYKNEEKFYGIKSFIGRLFELVNKNKSFIEEVNFCVIIN